MARTGIARRSLLLFGAVEAAHLVVGAGLSVCGAGACGGATTGKLVDLDARVRSEPEAVAGFTNDGGWYIELEQAYLGLGVLQLFAGDAASGELASWLGVRSAHAHPGHYDEGALVGEVLQPTVVDLLAGERLLAAGKGVAGHLASARVTFHAEPGARWAVWLQGVATRGSEVRRFRARAAPEELLSHHGEPEIWGCPFDEHAVLHGDGVIILTVRPTLWLQRVPFELHAGVGEPLDLDPLLPTHAAFLDGVRDRAAYRFRLLAAQGG